MVAECLRRLIIYVFIFVEVPLMLQNLAYYDLSKRRSLLHLNASPPQF